MILFCGRGIKKGGRKILEFDQQHQSRGQGQKQLRIF